MALKKRWHESSEGKSRGIGTAARWHIGHFRGDLNKKTEAAHVNRCSTSVAKEVVAATPARLQERLSYTSVTITKRRRAH